MACVVIVLGMVLEQDHCRMAVAAYGICVRAQRAVGLLGLLRKVGLCRGAEVGAASVSLPRDDDG
jgi:hypothetical protein